MGKTEFIPYTYLLKQWMHKTWPVKKQKNPLLRPKSILVVLHAEKEKNWLKKIPVLIIYAAKHCGQDL